MHSTDCASARCLSVRPSVCQTPEMIQDRAIVTMECKYKTVAKLSNGAILNEVDGWLVVTGLLC